MPFAGDREFTDAVWGLGATSLDPLDWQSRTGRVAKYSRDRSLAYVVWDGNRTFDRVSVRLIEPATSLPPDIADALVSY